MEFLIQKAQEDEHAWRVNGRLQLVTQEHVAEVSWSEPREQDMTMNIDGYSKGNPGQAATGGLFRDRDANWCGGFVVNMGITSAMQQSSVPYGWAL